MRTAGCCVFAVLILYAGTQLTANWGVGIGEEIWAGSGIPTQDGGYLAAGQSPRYFEYFEDGKTRIYVVKLYPTGTIQWQRFYGEDPVGVSAVEQAHDGGFVIAGQYSGGGWILKISSHGALFWHKTYFGVSIASIIPTRDGGYALVGMLGTDAWVAKLDMDGNLVWQYAFGGGATDRASYIQQTKDDGYIVVGTCTGLTSSGGEDVWVLKLDPQGGMEWQRAYGRKERDTGFTVLELDEGGYIVAGEAIISTVAYRWVLELFPDGAVKWQKAYEMTGPGLRPGSRLIDKTNDGGYLIYGQLFIPTPPERSWYKNIGFTVLKIDTSGTITRQKDFYQEALYMTSGGKTITAIHEFEGSYYAVGEYSVYRKGYPWNRLEIYRDCGVDVTPWVNVIETAFVSELTHVQPMMTSVQSQNMPGVYMRYAAEIWRFICGGGELSSFSLKPTQLFFGAVLNGQWTREQGILVSQENDVLLNWSASSDASWIAVSPDAGTGSGQIMVSINPAGLSPGNHSGWIIVSSSNAGQTPLYAKVQLRVYNADGTSPPFGFFDTPIQFSNVDGAVPVTGWALDDVEVVRVEIKRSVHALDPPAAVGPDELVYIGDAALVEGARPDIERIYPQFPLNSRGGWGYMMLTNMLPNQGNDTFTIHAFAYDKEGNRVKLGQKTITGNNAGSVKPFGAIDTPGQGEQISGAAFNQFGWVLTPLPNTIPFDGSTIGVWVDGVNLGHPAYNYARPALDALFPGLANTSGPVGLYVLDTTAYANGVHTIAWSAVDSGGNAEGIGSRYFLILNAGGAEIEGDVAAALNESAGRAGYAARNVILNRVVVEGIVPNISSPVYVTKGYMPSLWPEIVQPDLSGVVDIAIEEVQRVELIFGAEAMERALRSGRFSGRGADLQPQTSSYAQPGESTNRGFVAGVYSGYLLVGDELRSLPIGSTLDPAAGIFAWQPGPGFLGEYTFVFVRERSYGLRDKTLVRITIAPQL